MPPPPNTADRYVGRIPWTDVRDYEVNGLHVPAATSLNVVYGPEAGFAVDAGGVRPCVGRDRLKKRIGWPLHRWGRRPTMAGHFFVHPRLARWIRAFEPAGATTTLEVGCGDMTFADFLDPRRCYNGIDYAISEFQLDRTVRVSDRYNFALASALALPVADASVDSVVSIEVLPQIPDMDAAIAEIRRVLRPGGIFACSVANTFSTKYAEVGVPWFHRMQLRFDTLPGIAAQHGFEVAASQQAGRWLKWSTKLKLGVRHAPVTSADERENCFFLYAFRAI